MKEQETKDEAKKDKNGETKSKKQQAKSGKTESKTNSKAESEAKTSVKGDASKKSGKATVESGASAKKAGNKKTAPNKAKSKKSVAGDESTSNEAKSGAKKSGSKKSGSKKSGSGKSDSLKSANPENAKDSVNKHEEALESKEGKMTKTLKAPASNALVVKIKSLFSKKSNKNSAEQAEGKRYSVKSNNPAVRAKAVQQARKRAAARSKGSKKRPRKWLVPTFITFLIVGLVWIVLYYLSKSWPIPGLGDFNIFIGFALIVIGVVLATFWE